MTPIPPRRADSGDRILANLARAAAAVNARRTFVLNADELADVERRRAAGEPWASIAATFGRSHTTVMAAVERQRAAARNAAKVQR